MKGSRYKPQDNQDGVVWNKRDPDPGQEDCYVAADLDHLPTVPVRDDGGEHGPEAHPRHGQHLRHLGQAVIATHQVKLGNQ